MIAHVPQWADLRLDAEKDVQFTQLGGLANQCYRVKLLDHVPFRGEPGFRAIAHHKFVSPMPDRNREAIVSKLMSATGIGPHLIH